MENFNFKDLKQDKEATRALFVLLRKLGKKGIPMAQAEWDILQAHQRQLNDAIMDNIRVFKCLNVTYNVSLAWMKFAHHILAATSNYYSDARKEVQND